MKKNFNHGWTRMDTEPADKVLSDLEKSIGKSFEPKGTRFYSKALKREMMLVYEGQPWAGWIVYKHPDGHWVSYRKATQQDHAELGAAISKAHHGF